MGSGCMRGGENIVELEGPEGVYVAGGGVNGAFPGFGLKGVEWFGPWGGGEGVWIQGALVIDRLFW